MPFVQSDGVRLSYEVVGDGPPLLLHLGAGCDAELWRAAGYVDSLARSHRCILFDHRGHGRSDHPTAADAYHVDRFAEDVVALLDELDLRETAFWAYSNGIAVGLKVADVQPGRIIRIVGSGIISRPVSDEQLAASVAAAIANYREHGWEWLIDGFAQDEGPAPEWMQERIRATDVEPVIGWSKARLDWGWSAWEALPRIDVPTLFVVGELEDPDDMMAEAAARLPHGERVRVPGKGHINAYLDSAVVLPIVTEFLAR